MNETTVGATVEDIALHYDVSNAFYSLWLDPGMTYSCALWDGIEGDESQTDVLAAAQRAKLLYHLDQAGASEGSRILDVGCGWGSLLAAAVREKHIASGTGLTLSQEQLANVHSLGLPGVEARLQSWRDHQPEQPYDAIISIGAFEHFADATLNSQEKVRAYAEFFEKCYEWLPALGKLSLQTIAYEDLEVTGQTDAATEAFFSNEIFPGSTLPRLSEITAACDPYFAVTAVRNDGLHYARTLRAWIVRLMRARAEAERVGGADLYRKYRLYLRISEIAFTQRQCTLYRITLQRRPNRLGASR